MNPVLYPYPTLQNADLVLAMPRLRLDGNLRPECIFKDENSVRLHEFPSSWKMAEFDLEVACPPSAVMEFEREHGPISVVAVAHCLPTNNRQQSILTRSARDAGRWTSTIEIDHDNYRGRVSVSCTLTAKVEGLPFRPIASTSEWTVHIDEPESLQIKGTLPITWVNFTHDSAAMVARSYPTSTHVVDFTGSVPHLLLNSSFDGLEAILRDRKDRKGADKGLHDFLRTGIARSVWLELLHDSLAGIRVADPEDDALAEWPEAPWRTEVLKRILPVIAPGKSDAEILALASQDWRQPVAAGDLFAKAEAVIGDMVKANELVRRFVQSGHLEESQ